MQDDDRGSTVMDRFRLDGRTALVTGASRGIGKGIARGLAEAGADVGVVYRQSADQAHALVEELHDMGRSGSFAHQADVRRKVESTGWSTPL